jgi:ferrochelatase
VREGDPYPQQVAATAAAVAARAGLPRFRLAYQSAGRTPEPWIGPALEEALDELAREGVAEVVVAPIGFVSDHTEVLLRRRRGGQGRGPPAGDRPVPDRVLEHVAHLHPRLADLARAAGG